MNIDVLRDLFFVGDQADIDAFVASLKPRCIKPTDKTAVVDGVVNHLVYNTENGTYIAPDMSSWEEDPFSHELARSQDFVEVPIANLHQHNTGPRTRIIRSVRISKAALDSERYLFKYEDTDTYLFQDTSWTNNTRLKPVYNLFAKEWTTYWTIGYAFSYVYDFDPSRGEGDDRFFHATTEHGNELIVRQVDPTPDEVVCLYRPTGGWDMVLKSAVERYPDYFGTCSNCGKLWLAEDLLNGECPNCRSVELYGYHDWELTHDRKFLHADGETVSDSTLYFGTEVETQGDDPDNKNCVYGYQDVWHLEKDTSLHGAGAFEMISQPMTWEFILKNYERFKMLFLDLQAHGQRGHKGYGAGLHVHVSKKAFKDDKAILRAIAIVHGMSHSMKEFARRGNRGESTMYYEYYHLYNGFLWDDVKRIPHDGHTVAVNCHLGDPESFPNRDGRSGTVEFRIFRSTLNPVTYMATVQFVRNIVNVANSGKTIVHFADLLQGEWIDKYVEAQKSIGRWEVDPDDQISFVRAETDECIENFYNTEFSESSVDTLTEALRSMLPAEHGDEAQDEASSSEEGDAD